MTAKHEARIERLEAHRTPGTCTCANPTRVVYPENYRLTGDVVPETKPLVCEVCGLERITLKVVYDESTPKTH